MSWGDAASTSARTATASTLILGAAAACWVGAVRQMAGMDMGVATELGSFSFFLAAWVSMMAAMMLRGALPAALRLARRGSRLLAVPRVRGVVPRRVGGRRPGRLRRLPTARLVDRGCHRARGRRPRADTAEARVPPRCRETVRSGAQFGLYCVGSSLGLMAVLVALGVMSVGWMAIVAAVVLAQKLLPPRPAVDVPLALAIVALGILVLAVPTAVPGLTHAI